MHVYLRVINLVLLISLIPHNGFKQTLKNHFHNKQGDESTAIGSGVLHEALSSRGTLIQRARSFLTMLKILFVRVSLYSPSGRNEIKYNNARELSCRNVQ